jgi:murein DD-endopeptidase MepM/ murein hydrolase activator NlpD
MDRLRDTDIKLRTIADMDLLDESDLKSEAEGNDALIAEASSSISQMEREVSLREESYSKLAEVAKNDRALFVSAPAIKPVSEGWIWQRYGKRKSPFTGQPEIHEGITFVSRKDTPVLATGNGKVEKSYWDSKYGNQVLIDHGYGYKSFYGHMSRILVRPGQTVKRGSPIGYVGNTGRLAEGVGLFYQILVNRKPVDPEDYFPAE